VAREPRSHKCDKRTLLSAANMTTVPEARCQALPNICFASSLLGENPTSDASTSICEYTGHAILATFSRIVSGRAAAGYQYN